MPSPELTARQIITSKPQDLRRATGQERVEMLFDNFCQYAKAHYKYSALKTKDDSGNVYTGSKLLDYPESKEVKVDCATLAEALTLLCHYVLTPAGPQATAPLTDAQINDLSKENAHAKTVSVGGAITKFATKLNSQCFDDDIVGNIRPVHGGYSSEKRCVFGQHIFVQIGTRFYDPCMVTTYTTASEAMNWTLESGRGAMSSVVCKIKEDSSRFLIRIPDSNEAQHPGFKSGWLMCNTNQLNKADYQAAFADNKPMWKPFTSSVNQILKKSGIQGQHVLT